jgi:hypothetical protein
MAAYCRVHAGHVGQVVDGLGNAAHRACSTSFPVERGAAACLGMLLAWRGLLVAGMARRWCRAGLPGRRLDRGRVGATGVGQ